MNQKSGAANTQRGAESGKRRGWLLLIAIISVYLAASLLTYDRRPEFGDNFDYMLLARALNTTGKYVTIYKPDQKPNMHYPPGYPAALAAITRIFSDDYQTFKFFSIFCGALSLTGAYVFLRRRMSAGLLAAALIAASVNMTFLAFMQFVASEAFFLAVMFWGLALMTERPEKAPWLRFVAGAALIAAAAHIRSMGLFLLPGLGLYLAYRRSAVRLAALILISIAVIGPWFVRNYISDKSAGAYVKEQLLVRNPYDMDAGRANARDLGVRWVKNFVFQAAFESSALLAPQVQTIGLDKWVKKGIIHRDADNGKMLKELLARRSAVALFALAAIGALALAALALMARGYAADFKSGATCAHFIVPVFIFLTYFWPNVWMHIRLLLPVFFFLWFYAAKGLEGGGLRPNAKLAAAVMGILIMAGVLALAPAAKRASAENVSLLKEGRFATGIPRENESFTGAALWLKRNSPEKARVVTIKPAIFYYYSGRKSEIFPYTRKPVLYRMILDERIDYAVDDSFGVTTRMFMKPAIKNAPKAFIPVYKSADGTVSIYRIDRSNIPRR
ncbi:MAG: glycosyltransferase family 39 protein [bacterium]